MSSRRRARPALEVSVSGRRLPAAARGLGRWLAGAAPASASGTVDLALVGDATMRRLNREFRGVDRATDVLSFPSDDPAARRRQGSPPRPLGDIAIALGVARRQAREHGHDLRTELRILALHGLLHLLGYDHEQDDGRMRRVEERLRRRAGLPTGLIARAGRTVPS
ncbi:MAG: rRNA maturation RNase YbeY [Acidobacteriota bacterium]